MALRVWLTILLLSVLSIPAVLAQQTQWMLDLDYSKKTSTFGKDQNLEHSLQYCVKALAEARQLQSITARDVALDQIRSQLQMLQYRFDSSSQWSWAEQVTKWLLDIDLKNHHETGSFSMSTFYAASDYGKLAKYCVMQGRNAEAEKYAAQEKELKEQPTREAQRQASEFREKLEKQMEESKVAPSPAPAGTPAPDQAN